MPWYAIEAIHRMRNEALETERSDSAPPSGLAPSRADQIAAALPTLVVVLLWAVVCALIYCGVAGVSQWSIVMAAAAGPIAMVIVGASWGTRDSRLSSGLDAAIVTGAVVGMMFVLAAFF